MSRRRFLILAPVVLVLACADKRDDKQLPRVTVPTPVGGITFAFEERDGLAIAEGDILLGPYDVVLAAAAAQQPPPPGDLLEQPPVSPAFSIGTAGLAQRWPGGQVPYEIAPDLPDPQRVRDAIRHYRERTPIRLIQREGQADYIRIVPTFNPFAPNTSYSPLGRQGGEQLLGLSEGATAATAIHEIGHAIGLFHEQARHDRDEFVEVHLECVPVHLEYNFRKIGDWFWESGIALEQYDTRSVMHYESCQMSTAGEACVSDGECPTITTIDGDMITRSRTLTVDDVNGIYNMYGHFPNADNRAGESFGHALTAGDFDRDGHTDLAVGARADRLGELADGGSVYLFKGTDSGLVPWDILRMTPTLAFPKAGALYGSALTTGDFNADGTTDLVVGAPGYDVDGGTGGEGAVLVYFGERGQRISSERGLRIDQTTGGPIAAANARFGTALAAGDIDNDGLDELIVGAPARAGHNLAGPSAGYVYVLKGSPAGPQTGLNISETAPGGFGTQSENGDVFGEVLVTGNFNDDAFVDVAVGAPRDRSNGVAGGGVFIFFGSPAGPQPVRRLTVADFGEVPMDGDDFGGSLAVGEFDGEPGDDLVVGAIRRDAPGASESGALYMFRGRSDGVAAWTRLDSAQPQAGAHLGFALAVADFDGDGDEDLAASAVDGGTGAVRGGLVHLFRQQDGGLSPWTLLESQAPPPAVDDHAGHSLASGDFNEDGRADLAVGAPFRQPFNQPRAGLLLTYHGDEDGAPPRAARQFHQESPPPNGQ